jgi:putative ubiquitin-RnfH superfamily antitoxin RatB of RatAB toxin-antitoxin module
LANAYTPGLTVSGDITVRRTRRLPIKGEVLVQPGEAVQPTQVIARANLPGALQTIKLAEKLGVEAREVRDFFRLKEGDAVELEQVVAETKGFLGKFKSKVTSDFAGTIESISEVTGNVLVREAPIPVEITAYIQGRVAEVLAEEGATIETRGAMVQGIFGIGAERVGSIRVAVSGPDQVLHADNIHESDAGKILVAGSGFSYDALAKADKLGVIGLVAGGIKDSDLIQYLGYDIGVAITGQEATNLTLVVTEGFGYLNMAQRTFDLLKSLEGKEASINGATQIRAGVIRPELIVPLDLGSGPSAVAASGGELKVGTPIRVIREPYFGMLGAVTDLPAQLVTVESGTEVRVLKAKLEGGDEVTVPRANVEILAE